MLDDYFDGIEKKILDFKRIINSYTIYKKSYNEKQGYIKGDIVFSDTSRICFIEVKDTDVAPKNKYSYNYMDKDNGLIFRYDNAYHHNQLKTFPNHKHIGDEVFESNEPELYDIMLEIQKSINRGLRKGKDGNLPGQTK
ncbi:MAG: hypothetical protein GY950_05170 [bacterium]|nr:hypothetical protein [bacterium]